jgi:hypothetical protein
MAKQLTPFEKEFAAARDRYKLDKGTNPLDPKYNFDFKGKKYNVEYAEEKQARKGGKSSSAAPSKSSKSSDSSASTPTGAPITNRRGMTYEQMMEAGKNDPLVKENEQEREADWGEAKDTMKDVAITGAELLLAKRLGGAGIRTAGRLAKYGKKLFGAGKDAASGVGKYRQGIRKVEGELLPREASQAASSAQKRLPGPSPQGKLSGPSPQRRLTGPDNTPPSSGGAGRRPPPPPPPSGGAATRYQMRPTNATKADKAEAAARAKADRDLAAYERGDITKQEYLRGEYEPFKKGGKVPKPKVSSAGENAAYVKKEMAFMQRKGAPKSMIKHEKREANAGGMKKMAVGGMAQMTARSRLGGNVPAGGSMAAPGYYRSSLASPGGPAGRLGMPGSKPQVKPLKKGGGIEKKGSSPVQKFAKGGSIDGCAQRGKTRAKGRK